MFFQLYTLEFNFYPFFAWHFLFFSSLVLDVNVANLLLIINKCRCSLLPFESLFLHMFNVSIVPFLVLKVLSLVGD